jgi:hypothetical protein
MNELTKRGQFVPGQSGNPTGKPTGVRNILSKKVVEDLAKAWEIGGARALQIMQDEEPSKFVLACLSILPKDVLVSIAHQPSPLQAALEAATPEEQALIAEAFQLIGKLGHRALDLLRAEAAKQVARPRQPR